MDIVLKPAHVLPQDGTVGTLIGRAWLSGSPAGPSVVLVSGHEILDLSHRFATISDVLSEDDPVMAVQAAGAQALRRFDLEKCLANTASGKRVDLTPYLLAPIDLQAIKACGVTFAISMLERVIEERTKGDPTAAESIRRVISNEIGRDLRRIKPGSKEADMLKQALIQQNMWSQYLEVGLGPYAEIFTKAQPMSAVGLGSDIGIHPDSKWNNPEPEIVLIITPVGRIVGATLGNDVNLRDFEGRSALLLGRAKDNNASAALGPFIRLFDETFTIDDLRQAEISVKVAGLDQFILEDKSSMSEISRDITDLAQQTLSRNHQYPDGLALYVGTMFAPIKDRHAPGMGFTHEINDIVTIATPKLGRLTNRVRLTTDIEPWTFGTKALMKNLAQRGLLTN